MSGLTADEVAAGLGLDETYAPWLAQLDSVGAPEQPPLRPADDDVAAVLRQLECSQAAVIDTVATWPDAQRDRERWWLLDRAQRYLTARIGDFDANRGVWPQLPAGLGSAGSCFYLHLYAATVPATRAWHEAQGIPDAVSWTSLADVARHEAIYRRTHGATGVDAPFWTTLHLTGGLYELGRLQFEPFHFQPGAAWPDPAVGAELGEGFRVGDATLGVHIPAAGPLDADACEASYREATAFFDAYFPAPVRRVATCSSWLLDPQLADLLPATSNIVRFQETFERVPGGPVGDEQVLTFVFRNRGVDPETAEPRTLLERSVLAHLAAGRHFRWTTGWRDLVSSG